MKLAGFAAAIAVATWIFPACCADQYPYKVFRSVSLGAPGRWDYVTFDPTSHRVYVAHGDRVSVVDGRTGDHVGEVDGIPGGPHGIGLSTKTGQGFTDDGKAGSAVPFDLATLARKPAIKVGADADGIVVEPRSGHVFVINGDPGTLSVIDPATNAVISTIEVGGTLEFAVTDDRGHVYVDGKARHEIVRVNTSSNLVDARWSMPDCIAPHGLAIDVTRHRLFAGCANKVLSVLDADTGAVIANLPIGAGNDGVVFDPARNRVLSTNGRDGTLTVIQEGPGDTFIPLATMPTILGARTLAIDLESGRLFIPAPVSRHSEPRQNTSARESNVQLMMLDPLD